MTRTKLILRRLLVLASFLALSPLQTAQAFSISDVQLVPTSPITFGAEVKLKVYIFTLKRPTFLYRPTEVVFSAEFNKFLINLYPDTGPVNALGGLIETVSLGVVPVEEYVYEVQLHPPPPFHAGRYGITFGSFDVVPQLKIALAGTNIVLRWTSTADRYFLESSSDLSLTNGWSSLPERPNQVGSEFVLTVPISSQARFFRLRKTTFIL